MPEITLAPLFTAIEGTIGAAIPGVLGGAVVTGLEGGITGALGGAALSGLTGGDIGKGALGGALTGGLTTGLSPFVSETTGLSPEVAGALTGGGAGALASKVTGGNLLTGALGGALGGAALEHPGTLATGKTDVGAAVGGGARGAAATAAPSGLSSGAGDVTSIADRFASDFAPSPAGSLQGFDLSGYAAGGTGSGAAAIGAGAAGGAGGSGGAGAGGAASGGVGQAAGAAAAGGASSGSGGLGDIVSSLTKNPGALVSGGGLLLRYLNQQDQKGKTDALLSQLNQEAATASGRGNALQNYLISGTLPPGLQSGIDAATADAEATIKSNYAARGMSGSSAEYQDIQNARSRAVTQSADIASQLYSTGVNQSNIGTQIYDQLFKQSLSEDQQFSQSIGSFAAALAGMGQPVTPSPYAFQQAA